MYLSFLEAVAIPIKHRYSNYGKLIIRGILGAKRVLQKIKTFGGPEKVTEDVKTEDK